MIYDKSHAMPEEFAPLAMSLIITQKRVYEMNERIEKLSAGEPDAATKRKIADIDAVKKNEIKTFRDDVAQRLSEAPPEIAVQVLDSIDHHLSDEMMKRIDREIKEALLIYKFSYLYRSSNDIRQDPEKEPDIDLDKD